ncbi:MAG: hypothetical protein ABI551_23055, partial [Polyangiaceae bacterium]
MRRIPKRTSTGSIVRPRASAVKGEEAVSIPGRFGTSNAFISHGTISHAHLVDIASTIATWLAPSRGAVDR